MSIACARMARPDCTLRWPDNLGKAPERPGKPAILCCQTAIGFRCGGCRRGGVLRSRAMRNKVLAPILVVLGLFMLIGGFTSLNTHTVTCDGKAMRSGDTCQHVDRPSGHTSVPLVRRAARGRSWVGVVSARARFGNDDRWHCVDHQGLSPPPGTARVLHAAGRPAVVHTTGGWAGLRPTAGWPAVRSTAAATSSLTLAHTGGGSKQPG